MGAVKDKKKPLSVLPVKPTEEQKPPVKPAAPPEGQKPPVPPVTAQNKTLEDKLTNKTPMMSEEVKPRRGRPRKEDAKPAEPVRVIPTEANPMYIAFLLAMGKTIAKRTAPEMELTLEEAEGLALPLTQIIAYHFPTTSPIALVYLHMAVASVGVILPRLMIMGDIEKKKKEAALAAKTQATQQPTPAQVNG